MRLLLNRRPKHSVNLWIVPFKMSAAALLLFALTLTPDILDAHHLIHLPTWFTMGGIDDARAILAAMMGCVSTVLALIFSVILLVLSMVANLFGPRLLYRFVQDWVTQVCIGLFMAAFIYILLVFLVTHSDSHSTFIPQTCLITSWLLVVGAFGFLVFYSHRVAVLIQNPDAIARIVKDMRRAIAALPSNVPVPNVAPPAASVTRHLLALRSSPILSSRSGYVQEVDSPAIVAAAQHAGAIVRLHFRPGQFVLADELLGELHIAQDPSPLRNIILSEVAIGSHRVLTQDLEFGVAQIVEIAIRALSPAINDTFTGVASVDLLGEALCILAKVPQTFNEWHDTDGTLRLQGRPLLLHRLIRQAFDQIRQAAAGNPAVLLRLLSTLERLGRLLDGIEVLGTLGEEAEAVYQTAIAGDPVPLDRADFESAWSAAKKALKSAG